MAIPLSESELEYVISKVDPEHSCIVPLRSMLDQRRREDYDYMTDFINVADYVDDQYEEEYATVRTEMDIYPSVIYFKGEQKLPNIDVKKKTHPHWGPNGKLASTRTTTKRY